MNEAYERSKSMSKATAMGAGKTINEIRKAHGLPPLKSGDVVLDKAWLAKGETVEEFVISVPIPVSKDVQLSSVPELTCVQKGLPPTGDMPLDKEWLEKAQPNADAILETLATKAIEFVVPESISSDTHDKQKEVVVQKGLTEPKEFHVVTKALCHDDLVMAMSSFAKAADGTAKAAAQFTVALQKANPTEDEDGVLTKWGMQVAHQYARQWVKDSVRDVELEQEHPELLGLFYDIRADAELAREHAIEG